LPQTSPRLISKKNRLDSRFFVHRFLGASSLLAKYGKAEYLPLIKEYARESMGFEFD